MSQLQYQTSAADTPALRKARRFDGWLVLFACLLIFGLLHNPYWSRGGDSDVYLAIARNVFHGKGLTFNNNPVAVVPPLWPWVLAGALKISSSFWFLKLIPMSCMTGAMLVWYRILSRYLPQRSAALTMILCAGLSQVFTLALWFHTEAFYCLLSSLAVLLAMQINEGKSFWWRAVLIILLLVGSIYTRWAGVTWWAIVAGALFRGQWPTINRKAVLAVVSLGIVFASFIVMRRELKVDQSAINPLFDSSLAGSYELAPDVTFRDYANRAIVSGNWFGGLLWQAARDFKPLRLATLGAGWIVLMLLCWRTYLDVVCKDWLLLAAMMQATMLCIGWPDPVSRYFVPMAPLFLLGMIRMGQPDASAAYPEWFRTLQPWALRLFVGSIVLCNAFSFAIEVFVAHRPNYYAHYQAGLNDDLINIARYIDDHDIAEGRIAMNRADANGNRVRISNGWLRAFNVLTDRAIRNLPKDMEGAKDAPTQYAVDDPRVIQWLEREGITHYLYRSASNTMWHFRMGDDSDNAGEWELYEIKNGRAIRVEVPEVDNWPRSLPEM